MDEEMPLTLPDTQNVAEVPFIQSQKVESTSCSPIWGRLFPISHRLKQLAMTKDVYTVGRLPSCDICLTRNEMDDKELSVVSKIHFRIFRECLANSADFVTYLEDLSFNGTFINKVLIGKGKKVILRSNDVIALAKSSLEVYSYVNSSSFESDGLPHELHAKYVVSRVLGSGACGDVKLILDIFNNQKFALKSISKRSANNTGSTTALDNKRIRTEVEILRSLRHPCIIKMIEIVDTPSKMFIVLEMMEGGELFDRIAATDGLTECVAKFICYQIAHAVYYLHSKGITHRDLKPENILLASNAKYPLTKVTDFGLSKFVDEATLMQTFCGTPMYVAPEILLTNGRGSYTKQVDVWSLGVILYVCLAGRTPFSSQLTRIPLREQIIKGKYEFYRTFFGGVSKEAIDLIKQMMTTEPNKRITIRNILQHPWFEDHKMRRDVHIVMGSNEENHAPMGLRNRPNHAFDEQIPPSKRFRHF